VPAQQVEPLIPWLMKTAGAKKFYLPSADYIWPHLLNEAVRRVVGANGGEIVGEGYFPLDHMDYASTVANIMSSGADVVFDTIVPPGLTPFLGELHRAGFTQRGGKIVCTYFDENFLNLVPAEMAPGQHHVRMNMYIAQAQGGRFHVVKHLGPIDPDERVLEGELEAVAAG
jgi:branched-chain amino acid transport system substrate-binding protein